MNVSDSRFYRDLYQLDSEQEVMEISARLQIAADMGLIESPALPAVEERRDKKNQEIHKKLQAGEIVYGVRKFTPAMYLSYELTRFKLEFTVFQGEMIGSYRCHVITEEEKKNFFEENRDLFTRYHGDSFTYEDVQMIIGKRLKEMEYEKLVQNILCKFS